MNSLNKIENHSDNPQVLQCEYLGIFMPELMEIIFSSLKNENRQQTMLVCKHWSISTIAASKKNNFFKIAFFIEELTKSEFINSNLKEKLIHVKSKRKSLMDSVNLLQIKSSTLEIQENILHILKSLREKEIYNLNEKIKHPKIFKEIFDLAIFYRKVEQALPTPCPEVKSHQLKSICQNMANKKHFEQAIKVAQKIPLYQEKVKVLESIAEMQQKNQSL